MSRLPGAVIITESSPRDGLQSLSASIPTAAKVELIRDLAAAGIRSVDAVSFVNPRAVPQMADGEEVLAGLQGLDGVVLQGLVPNLRGLERALAAKVDRIGVLTAASDTFSLRNTNSTVEESMQRIRGILSALGPHPQVEVRGYVSVATHCPYEGPTDPERVAELAEILLAWGCHEVFLGETIGRGTPPAVERLLQAVLARVPAEQVGAHFHDTFGQALANTVVALEHGVARFDSSAAGLGGCPYAPGAAGNVATEDLIYLLDGYGISHGIELATVARVGADFCRRFDLPHRSKAGQAVLAAGGGE
jgi:hydroxymethylglutaryl-CoA lyase